MKKFEIWQELSKCKSDQKLLKKMVPIDLLCTELSQTFKLFLKSSIYGNKYYISSEIKVKHNKTRYICANS